jgi:hypothetical protein
MKKFNTISPPGSSLLSFAMVLMVCCIFFSNSASAHLIRMGYQLLLVVEIILGVFMLLVEYILQLYHLRGFGKTSDLVVQPEPYLQDRRIQFVQEALQGQWVAQ